MRAILTCLMLVMGLTGCRPKAGALKAPPLAATPAADGTLRGRVAERIDAAPYSYLRLESGMGEAWVAVPQTAAASGTEVVVVNATPMRRFESKTLKRTFELVYFGTLQDPGGPVANRGIQHALAAQGPSDVKVPVYPKADGPEARTVAEVHAQRAVLQDKVVVIHGQVVKVSNDIMGRNWMHLRDGSGTGPTADLSFTTRDAATPGDVVVMRGTVRLDKDFGAGYRYPVIIEDAKLTRGKR